MPFYYMLVRPHQEGHVKFWVLDLDLEMEKQLTFNRVQPYNKGFENCELEISKWGTEFLDLKKSRSRIR